MVNKYTLGSIVLGIALMAIWLARQAVTWTPDSAAQTPPETGTVVSSANQNDADQTGSNAGSQADDSFISQADGAAEPDPALSSVEEAGTYIQRQQSVGEDESVAGTPVTITDADSPVFAQDNTTVDPQPTSPASPTPTPTQPNSTPAVPALW